MARIHPILPLLPPTTAEVDRHVRNCVKSSPRKLVDAFTFALSFLLPEISNGTAQTATFSSVDELVQWAANESRVSPVSRTVSENFIFMWLSSIVYLHLYGFISHEMLDDKTVLLEKLLQVASHLVESFDFSVDEGIKTEAVADRSLAYGSYDIICILARLHSLGTNAKLITERKEASSSDGEIVDYAMLTDAPAVLSRTFASLQSLILLANHTPDHGPVLDSLRVDSNNLSDRLYQEHKSHNQARALLRSVRQLLPRSASPMASEITRQLFLFISLDLSRVSFKYRINSLKDIHILQDMCADYLLSKPVTIFNDPIVNPVLSHLFILTTFTVLEMAATPFPLSDPIQDDKLQDQDNPAVQAIYTVSKLFSLLQTLTSQPHGPSSVPTDQKRNWTTILSSFILWRFPSILTPEIEIEKLKQSVIQKEKEDEEEEDEQITVPTTATSNGEAINNKPKTVRAMLNSLYPDFSLLAQRGWLRVLADFVTVAHTLDPPTTGIATTSSSTAEAMNHTTTTTTTTTNTT